MIRKRFLPPKFVFLGSPTVLYPSLTNSDEHFPVWDNKCSQYKPRCVVLLLNEIYSTGEKTSSKKSRQYDFVELAWWQSIRLTREQWPPFAKHKSKSRDVNGAWIGKMEGFCGRRDQYLCVTSYNDVTMKYRTTKCYALLLWLFIYIVPKSEVIMLVIRKGVIESK